MPKLQSAPRRYEAVTAEKADGATYTPPLLADFVAKQMVASQRQREDTGCLRVLDPAVGDGELLLSLLKQLSSEQIARVEVHGFDTNSEALAIAENRLKKWNPQLELCFTCASFLDHVLDNFGADQRLSLFQKSSAPKFDFVIANPPYVRTQVMGADRAQELALQFGLSGRVDLYQAFLIGIAQVLNAGGCAGVIVSNRFMTTKSGSAVRQTIEKRFQIEHVWDLGDTKLFEAAVLPAVLLLHKRQGAAQVDARFSTIYETTEEATQDAANAIAALDHSGIVSVSDGRRFCVKHGRLADSKGGEDVWRVACDVTDDWLHQVASKSWGTFRDIGKVRVGVKTCADKVFIRKDWETIPSNERPELLRPLITHHGARRYRANATHARWQILYPHEVVTGTRRAVDLALFPSSRRYLEDNRETLEARRYVLEAGRAWFEIWVPQDPDRWAAPKLVFRDISEKPTFWIDSEGSIVNGDCYWMTSDSGLHSDHLWLACAVANSTFIEEFYDRRFNNKLYAGRRRFITQYVEQFPLPDPECATSREIIRLAQEMGQNPDSNDAGPIERRLDELVWSAFGLPIKEVAR